MQRLHSTMQHAAREGGTARRCESAPATVFHGRVRRVMMREIWSGKRRGSGDFQVLSGRSIAPTAKHHRCQPPSVPSFKTTVIVVLRTASLSLPPRSAYPALNSLVHRHLFAASVLLIALSANCRAPALSASRFGPLSLAFQHIIYYQPHPRSWPSDSSRPQQ